MAFRLGDFIWFIKADKTDFNKKVKQIYNDTKTLGKSFTKLGKAITAGFAIAAVVGIAKVSKQLILAASDAEETRNKFDVVFGDVSKAAESAATSLSDNFGLSSTASRTLLSDTGDLLSGFGFTGEAALDLSTQVNELAVDLASFTNFSGGAEGASAALTKALLGERESVKALGISILDADVKAKVLQQTQEGLTFETERQAKAYATLTIAQEQSKNAIGDFARSSQSFANQQRIAIASVDDLKVSLGEGLLPIATESVKIFAGLTKKLTEFIEERKRLKAAEDAENKTIEQRIILAKKELETAQAFLRAKNTEIEAFRDFSLTEEENERNLAAIRETFAREETERVQAALDLLYELQLAKQSGIAEDKDNAERKKEQDEEEAERDAELTAKFIENQQSVLNSLIQKLEEAKEARDDYNAQILEDVVNSVNDRISAEDQWIDALTSRAIREREIRRANFAFEQELAFASVALASSTFGAISSILDSVGAKNRETAIAMKALAAAEAGINTGLAFTKTLADGGPYPLNLINAGAILASGVAQEIKILSTPIPSFETGGIVPGNSFTGDNVLTRQNSKEMDISTSQQKALWDFISNGSVGGPSGQMVVNVQLGKKTLVKAVVDGVNNGLGGVIDARVVR